MKTVFAKYNSERLSEFQILTMIKESEQGSRLVKKEALTAESTHHIKEIYRNAEIFAEAYGSIGIEVPTHYLDETGLSIDYLDAVSLDKLLLGALHRNDLNEFRGYISEYLHLIDKMVSKKNAVFIPSDECCKIFGDMQIDRNCDLISPVNIDLIFGNIFVKGNSFSVIDCEWIFDFEMPKEYVIWRAFSQFCDNYLNKKIYNTFRDYLCCLYDKNEFASFENMFINYVFGKEKKYRISSRYLKKTNDCRKNTPRYTVLYYTSDASFCQENSVYNEIHLINNQDIEISFDFPKGQKMLRWDPVQSSLCLVKIHDMFFYGPDNSPLNCLPEQMENNAEFDADGYMVFLRKDPYFFLSTPEDAQKITIRCSLNLLEDSAGYHYFKAFIHRKDELLQQKDELLQQKDDHLHQKDELLHQKDELLHQKDELLHQKDDQLLNLKRSKSYRIGRCITFPLRFFLKKIRYILSKL